MINIKALQAIGNIYAENSIDFQQKLQETRTNIYKGTVDFSKHTRYDSIKDLSDHLESGRFSVNIDGAHFECLFIHGFGEKLYVVYNGSREIGNTGEKYQTKFGRWSYHNLLDGSYLFIDDPMFFEYGDLLIGWYYGTESRSYLIDSIKIIKKVCEANNYRYDHVVFFSSSGGGYAGLYASTFLENSLSISINPQIYIQDYSYAKQFENLTGINLRNADDLMRNLMHKRIMQSNSTHVILVNSKCQHDLDVHVKKLADNLNMDIRYGLSRHCNTLIWLYDAMGAPSAHVSFETKPLFAGINYIATNFKNGVLDFDKLQHFSLLMNEVWSEFYALKVKLHNYESLINKNNIITLDSSKSYAHNLSQAIRDVYIKKSKSDYNYFKVINVKPNTIYSIQFRIRCSENFPLFTAGLYDFSQSITIEFRAFEFEKVNVFNFATGHNVSGVAFLIYAGEAGKTNNIDIHIGELNIYEDSLIAARGLD